MTTSPPRCEDTETEADVSAAMSVYIHTCAVRDMKALASDQRQSSTRHAQKLADVEGCGRKRRGRKEDTDRQTHARPPLPTRTTPRLCRGTFPLLQTRRQRTLLTCGGSSEADVGREKRRQSTSWRQEQQQRPRHSVAFSSVTSATEKRLSKRGKLFSTVPVPSTERRKQYRNVERGAKANISPHEISGQNGGGSFLPGATRNKATDKRRTVLLVAGSGFLESLLATCLLLWV